MKFCIVKAEQRSELWFASRAGRVTGSKADAPKSFRAYVVKNLASEWSALKALSQKVPS